MDRGTTLRDAGFQVWTVVFGSIFENEELELALWHAVRQKPN